MDGARNVVVATILALIVVLGGCSTKAAGDSALEDYVKKECAIVVDLRNRLAGLTRDLVDNSKDQAALADTVQDIANAYDENIAKGKQLGDPPNGEGTGDDAEVEQAAKNLSDVLGQVATDIRTAKTNAEVQAAMAHMNDTILKSTTVAADYKRAHPTPEIDRLEKAIPGCSDAPE